MSAGSTSRPTRAPASPLVSIARRRPERFGAVLFALAVALALSACGGGGGSTTAATPTATSAPPSTGSDEAPLRDLADLARRMRGVSNLPLDVALPPLAVGDLQQFDALVLPADPGQVPERRTASAEVRAISAHAYFLVETGSDVTQEQIDEAARVFEEEVWPLTAELGLPPDPGVDRDPRIVILHADLGPAVGGYVSDEDSYRREAAPHSNQREMLYLNLNVRPLGGPDYIHVLAHEFQHLVHRRYDQGEDTWVNEGLSEVAAGLATGSGGGFHGAFLDKPDTQLTVWSDLADSTAHYGAASLFVSYLLEQTGAAPRLLVSQAGDGVEGVEQFLLAAGSGRTFEEMVADWTVANLLDQSSGPYGYGELDVSEPDTQAIDAAGAGEGNVHQFAADYLELDGDDFPSGTTLTFQGATQVAPVAAQEGADGAFWWSGTGDNIDSMLTRELDLTGVQSATLTFRSWVDIERWFDWGQLAVSRDGGRTWQALAGRQTTTDDPLGVGYGPGYNGRSGGGEASRWVDERVDLSAYAGSKVLVRFEVITDDSASRPGWAIDDIAVAETGFGDDAESDAGGWERAGWRRVSEPLRQRFELRVVTFGPGPEVTSAPVDTANRAEVDLSGLGTEYSRAVVAVVALTEGTAETAGYQYEVGGLSP